MDLQAMIHGIALCGFFPSRAFLPTFLTALLLRFGNDLPWVRTLPILAQTPDAPTWFTHGIALTVLGLLALLEVVATKDDDAEELLELIGRYLKPGVAVLCFLGVLSARDGRLVESIATPAQQAGLLDGAWIVGAGLLVHYLAALRANLRLVLRAADEEDVLGVRWALSWTEDVWTVFGLLLVFLYPLAMLALLALVFAVLHGVRWLLEKREEQRLTPCAGCGKAIHPCALACPGCGLANAQPHDLGFFGQSLCRPAPDREVLPFRLVEKRRCARCATRLPLRHPRQNCLACGHDAFASDAFRTGYVSTLDARLWPTLGLGFLFSLVPVAGLVPGILLVRQRLTSPFGRYLPTGRRFLTRWGLRLLFVGLLSIHWIPGLGGIVVPLIGWLGFRLYRHAFVGLCREAPTGFAATALPRAVPAVAGQAR
jgi:hypothetical protein